MKRKVSIISLGCPKNLVDSEVMLGILKKKGWIVSENAEGSDIAIVNTCSFIEKATKESVDRILELAQLKKKNKIKYLIVAGCLPQKYKKKELLDGFGEVDAFVGSSDFPKIDSIIKKITSSRAAKIAPHESPARSRPFIVDSNPNFLYNGSHPRHILTPSHYVYMKIADGCSNRCSYCLIPGLRGKYRSRKMASIVREVRKLSDNNKIAEINLIAQDTTFYGTDIYGSRKLVELLRRLVDIKACGWIRLLYTHPAHLDDGLIELMKEEPSICKYIDLPLQHINDSILKRMGRKIRRREIVALIEKLRRNVPGIALRTSLIAGFPGETDRQFRELLDFVSQTRFDRVGVFEYSREKGTRAYNYSGQVTGKVKKSRRRALMLAQQKVSEGINRSFVGKQMKVLVDGVSSDKRVLLCRTYRDAPEVDGYVLVKSGKGRAGDFLKIKITGANAYDLTGKII